MKRYFSLLSLTVFLTGCGANSTEPAAVKTAANSAASPSPAAAGATYDELLAKSEELAKQRQFNDAVKQLTQAIAVNPDRAEAYVKRAAICSEVNLLAQAVVDMTSALRLEPENAKFLNTRGYFLLLGKQYERADSDFSDAIGFDLQYPQPYNNRGLVLVAQGKYEDAIKNFDNALRAKPDYLDAHNNRGFALLQLDQLEGAVEAFTRVLELDPKYLNGLTNRARAYLKLNKPTEAINDLTRAIELQPDQLQHYVSRAEAYRLQGSAEAETRDLAHVEWLRTLTDLNLRIARSPRDADAWAIRGRHLLIEQRYQEARQSFDNALALIPAHPMALTGLAEMAMEQDDFASAVTSCTEVLKHEFSYETYSLRGDAYFALEQYGEAIADYESARRFDDRVVEAYRQRAQQLRAKGDEQLAQADEQFAAGLQTRLTEANNAVGKTAPREMVIEQASYEAPAAQPAPAAKPVVE